MGHILAQIEEMRRSCGTPLQVEVDEKLGKMWFIDLYSYISADLIAIIIVLARSKTTRYIDNSLGKNNIKVVQQALFRGFEDKAYVINAIVLVLPGASFKLTYNNLIY